MGPLGPLLDGLRDRFLEPEHHNLPIVVTFWRFMLSNFSSYGLYTWVFYILVIAAYFIGGGFFAAIDFLDLASKYKLQPTVKISFSFLLFLFFILFLICVLKQTHSESPPSHYTLVASNASSLLTLS